MVREADSDRVFGFNNVVERDLDANKVASTSSVQNSFYVFGRGGT